MCDASKMRAGFALPLPHPLPPYKWSCGARDVIVVFSFEPLNSVSKEQNAIFELDMQQGAKTLTIVYKNDSIQPAKQESNKNVTLTHLTA